ncbi:MAG: hypothetical protein UT28_C0001G0417 [Berkelbacteria bacterium GW2011_GWE1_39_12]|uniref:Uncharacterized protein n=1 Tax=Berkelbacteria bacterium GW2011_GWE1_39_12 TaxID=1618337 RepID=A0A0G4B4A9_9BACT|nr:MAG: hypothetical protein UT28_C0001G0417 [Berkelbacteria bacterium GW2011_GWE1_39_12]
MANLERVFYVLDGVRKTLFQVPDDRLAMWQGFNDPDNFDDMGYPGDIIAKILSRDPEVIRKIMAENPPTTLEMLQYKLSVLNKATDWSKVDICADIITGWMFKKITIKDYVQALKSLGITIQSSLLLVAFESNESGPTFFTAQKVQEDLAMTFGMNSRKQQSFLMKEEARMGSLEDFLNYTLELVCIAILKNHDVWGVLSNAFQSNTTVKLSNCIYKSEEQAELSGRRLLLEIDPAAFYDRTKPLIILKSVPEPKWHGSIFTVRSI